MYIFILVFRIALSVVVCRSPANIGTFAIDKAFFNEIGAYDEDMWGWGGDNVDLALRVISVDRRRACQVNI